MGDDNVRDDLVPQPGQQRRDMASSSDGIDDDDPAPAHDIGAGALRGERPRLGATRRRMLGDTALDRAGDGVEVPLKGISSLMG
jgi:hypothetical protein